MIVQFGTLLGSSPTLFQHVHRFKLDFKLKLLLSCLSNLKTIQQRLDSQAFRNRALFTIGKRTTLLPYLTMSPEIIQNHLSNLKSNKHSLSVTHFESG